jgi:hypothetical protein
MRQRINNPTAKGYKHYGGRGIKIDPRWDDFTNFQEDMGEPPFEGASLDRIDVNGDYTKNNCRWATTSTQNHNVRPRSNTGILGITFIKVKNHYRWSVSRTVDGERKQLYGTCRNLEEAKQRRAEAEAVLWPMEE